MGMPSLETIRSTFAAIASASTSPSSGSRHTGANKEVQQGLTGRKPRRT